MSLHNSYLIALSTLFAVVFAIMIYSLARHRRSAGEPMARFFGPSGSVQWLWAMIPIAILAGIDFALIETPEDRSSMAPKKIELAVVQNLPSTFAPSTVEAAADSSEQPGEQSAAGIRAKAFQ